MTDPSHLDTPQILDLPAFAVARVHITTPASEIRQAMQSGLRELRDTLAAQGVEPTGPWFTHHLKMPDQTFDFEICLPISVDVKPEGRVAMGEIRAARTRVPPIAATMANWATPGAASCNGSAPKA